MGQDPRLLARVGNGAGDLLGFGAAERLSADGRVVRVGSSPTGRFAVTWQRAPYPYEIQARFGGDDGVALS